MVSGAATSAPTLRYPAGGRESRLAPAPVVQSSCACRISAAVTGSVAPSPAGSVPSRSRLTGRAASSPYASRSTISRSRSTDPAVLPASTSRSMEMVTSDARSLLRLRGRADGGDVVDVVVAVHGLSPVFASGRAGPLACLIPCGVRALCAAAREGGVTRSVNEGGLAPERPSKAAAWASIGNFKQ